MKTIALRFANNFAPKDGTIAEHEKIIAALGFVWYGKLGSSVSQTVANEILSNDNPKILLIHSGSVERYWAYIVDIQHEIPDCEGIPYYYRYNAKNFKTWFKIVRIEPAAKDVLSKCIVASSQRRLSEASRRSMSPYFIIYTEE